MCVDCHVGSSECFVIYVLYYFFLALGMTQYVCPRMSTNSSIDRCVKHRHRCVKRAGNRQGHPLRIVMGPVTREVRGFVCVCGAGSVSWFGWLLLLLLLLLLFLLLP